MITIKKTIKIFFITVVTLCILSVAIPSVRATIVACITDAIYENMEERAARGIGMKTVLAWNDCVFVIDKLSEKCLMFQGDNYEQFSKVLHNVSNYKIKNRKLYVVAEEGYAIIDKNNFCRVYITEFNKDYLRDYIIDEKIIYLESKNDFSDKEIKVFNNMEK